MLWVVSGDWRALVCGESGLLCGVFLWAGACAFADGGVVIEMGVETGANFCPFLQWDAVDGWGLESNERRTVLSTLQHWNRDDLLSSNEAI